MRRLSDYELTLIAGGMQSGTTVDDPGGAGQGGGSPPPKTDPNSISVGPIAASSPEAVAAELQDFFTAAGDTVDAGVRGGDQNSDPEAYQNAGFYDEGFMEMWGDLPTVQNDPASQFIESFFNGVDPEFLAESFTGDALTGDYFTPGGNYSGGISMQFVDNTHATFNINGAQAYGIWQPGESSASTGEADINGNPSEIVVTAQMAGYWEVSLAPMPGFSPETAPPAAAPSSTPPPASHSLPSNWNTSVDNTIDSMAHTIAAQISAEKDQNIEYSAVIWADSNGVFHQSAIIPGNHNDTGVIGIAPYGIPADGQLVAQIHSHPANFYEKVGGSYAEIPDANHVYIDNTDLAWLNTYANAGVTYANGGNDMSRMYIVHDGITDEYDHIQNNGPLPYSTSSNQTIVSQAIPMPNAVKADH